MAKKSLKQLEAENAELRQLCANAGVELEPAPPTIMDDIKTMEEEAYANIIDIICACEKRTGRSLPKVAVNSGGVVKIAGQFTPSPTNTLKKYLKGLGVTLAREYEFNSYTAFNTWGREYIIQGFASVPPFHRRLKNSEFCK